MLKSAEMGSCEAGHQNGAALNNGIVLFYSLALGYRIALLMA